MDYKNVRYMIIFQTSLRLYVCDILLQALNSIEESLVQGLLTAKDRVFALGLYLCAKLYYFSSSIKFIYSHL